MDITRKNIIVFDLDGTLAESRAPIGIPISQLLEALLTFIRVGVLSGGSLKQINDNVVNRLGGFANLGNLTLLPTCGSSFYTFENGKWNELYSIELSSARKKKIIDAVKLCLTKVSFSIDQIWGNQFQDKGTQITFSALGDVSPHDIKKNWDPDFKKRMELRQLVAAELPDLEVKIGGTTSLDITNRGIDKAFGIRKIEEFLGVKKENILFVGDAIFPDGNDYAVKEYGVDCVSVNSPEETTEFIRTFIKDYMDKTYGKV